MSRFCICWFNALSLEDVAQVGGKTVSLAEICRSLGRSIRVPNGFSGHRGDIAARPYCRRMEEGRQVIEVMATQGLRPGDHDLAICVMCEVPNNVIEIDGFSALFDGIAIGSKELAQLSLGVDRDSERIVFDSDERHAGVLKMTAMAVAGAIGFSGAGHIPGATGYRSHQLRARCLARRHGAQGGRGKAPAAEWI